MENKPTSLLVVTLGKALGDWRDSSVEDRWLATRRLSELVISLSWIQAAVVDLLKMWLVADFENKIKKTT